MAPVYVREQGAVVRRRGERLIVTRKKEELLDLPLIHLDPFAPVVVRPDVERRGHGVLHRALPARRSISALQLKTA